MRAWLIAIALGGAGCGTSELGGRCAADPAACADSAADETITIDTATDTTLPDTVDDTEPVETAAGGDTGSDVAETALADSGSADVAAETATDSSAPVDADAAAVDAAVCAASTKWCVGTALHECSASGTSETVTACGVACTGGICIDPVQIAVGGSHACALLSDGTVRCWGLNGFGQLGNGMNVTSAKPVTVSGLATVTNIGAGYSNTCARKTDGSVLCWGSDEEGEIGDPVGGESNVPKLVSGNYSQIAVGLSRACAVRTSDAALFCWGGTPGDGSTQSESPKEVTSLGGVNAIAAGGHGCALPKGTSTWRCWGGNAFGQVGDGTTTDRSTPVVISASGAIAVGLEHTCSAIASGGVFCWGRNQFGQLGDGTVVNRPSPTSVAIASAIAVAAGYTHTCALLTDATVKCWGSNVAGEIGDGTKADRHTPTLLALTGVKQVGAGQSFTCALFADRTVRCWGTNTTGQLGDGTFVDKLTATAVKW